MSWQHVRRSDRVSLRIPVEVSGPDASGGDFHEQTQTLQISRHGATVVLQRELAPRQVLTVNCATTQKKGRARVVGALGGQGQGHVYGIVLEDNDPRFWGVAFPPLKESEGAVARVLLECAACQAREVVYLNELELEVFEANHQLTRRCDACADSTAWLRAAEGDGALPRKPLPAASTPNRRRQMRIRVKMTACIRHPGFGEELVEVENVSRGGMCFHSRKKYLSGSGVEVALPYEPGAANVFVPARIVRSGDGPGGAYSYGVAYIRAHKGWPRE